MSDSLDKKKQQAIELTKEVTQRHKKKIAEMKAVIRFFEIRDRRPKWINDMTTEAQVNYVINDNHRVEQELKELFENSFCEGVKFVYDIIPDSVFDYWLTSEDGPQQIKQVEVLLPPVKTSGVLLHKEENDE